MAIIDLINESLIDQDVQDIIDKLFNKPESDGVVTSNQYNYTHVDTFEVFKNPEEYIISEELPACKMLWDRGIETYMCGNYDDGEYHGRWIGIQWGDLSEENRKIFDELIKIDSRYSFGHWYKIRVPFGENAANELCSLVEPLQYQDTKRFVSGASFLDSYKRLGSEEYYIDKYGNIHHSYNSQLANATLEEALKNTGKEYLYDPILDRVYDDEIFMDWHNNYVEHQKRKIDEWNYNAHYENGVETLKRL